MSYAIDPSLAANAASTQDLAERRRAVESLSPTMTDEERRAKLRDACEGFEAIFIQKMWEQMRATLPKDGLMHSKEEEFWQSMYDQELGKSMASSGGIGLSDMMMAQLDRNHSDISDATRVSTTRRPMLEVPPAPLLPDTTADASAQAAPVAASAATRPIPQSLPDQADLHDLYEGEAAQPDAPLEGGLGGAGGTGALQTSNMAAEDTPASVRQTLDELTAMVAARPETAPEENPERPAVHRAMPGISTASADNVQLQFQRMTGQAPPQASTVHSDHPTPLAAQPIASPAAPAAMPAPMQAEAASSEDPAVTMSSEPAEPVVTRITYQTNLPASQRTASPLQSRQTSQRQPVSQTAAAPAPATAQTAGQTVTAPVSAQPIAQSVAAASTQVPAATSAVMAMAESTPRPVVVAETDILSGISPRFIPSRMLAQADRGPASAFGQIQAATQAPVAETPAMVLTAEAPGARQSVRQAGGPALRAPEELARPVPLGNPAPANGSLTAPVQGEISSSFGWRLDPLTGQRAWHAGVDIKARPGEGVRAALDGVVTFAGEHPELGNLVVVEHGDGLATFYGHNRNLEVAVGQHVSAGMELAQAGASGRAAGTHVHFEVRRGELALNPEPLLRQEYPQVASTR